MRVNSPPSSSLLPSSLSAAQGRAESRSAFKGSASLGKGWSQIKVLPPRGPQEPKALWMASMCPWIHYPPPTLHRLAYISSLTSALSAPISLPELKKVQGSKGANAFSSKKHLPSYNWHLCTGWQQTPFPHRGWQGRAPGQELWFHSATPLGMRAGWEALGKAGFYRKTLFYQKSIFLSHSLSFKQFLALHEISGQTLREKRGESPK